MLRLLQTLVVAALVAAASADCGQSKLQSGVHNVTVTVGNVLRTFTVSVPWQSCGEDCTGEPPSAPTPMVINWHGCNNHTPVVDYQRDVSRVDEAAADRGWLSVTPVGTVMPDPTVTLNRYVNQSLGFHLESAREH